MRKATRHRTARLRADRLARGDRDRFDEVERFAMFLGFPRSGSSLVGQLLNAHRSVVVAHEADALRHVAEGCNRDQLFALILDRDRRFCQKGMQGAGGYDFMVAGQWQGRTERLRVIGDKKAGATTTRLANAPELLERFRATVGVPLRIVNVVRNPFDNISTWSRRSGSALVDAATNYFEFARMIADARSGLDPDEVLEIRLEDLIAEPRSELARLCEFLEVDAPPEYLDACAGLVFPSPRKTRDGEPWTPDVVHSVEEQAAEFRFLAGYEFA